MAIVIDLRLDEDKKLQSVFDKLIQSLDRLAAALQNVQGGFSGVANAANRAKSATSKITAPPITDPSKAAAHYWNTFQNSGNPADLRQYNAAQRMLNRQQKALTPLQQMYATARLAIGPNGKVQIMPLLNKMLAAGVSPAGIGSMLNLSGMGASGATAGAAAGGAGASGMAGAAAIAGPIAIAAAGLAAEFLALKAVVSGTVSTLIKFASSIGYGGGSVGQTWRLAGLGLTGQDAYSIGQRASTGYGAAMAMRYGVNPIGGPFGDMNYTGKALKILERFMTTSDVREARQMAEVFGLQDKWYLRQASPYWKKQALQGESSDTIVGAREMADFRVAVDVAKRNWQQLVVELGTPILKGAAAAMSVLMKAVNGIRAAIKFMDDHLPSWLKRILGGGGTDRDIATKENTRAINANTRVMKEGREWLGGPRGDRAMPAAWTMTAMQQGMKADILGPGIPL